MKSSSISHFLSYHRPFEDRLQSVRSRRVLESLRTFHFRISFQDHAQFCDFRLSPLGSVQRVLALLPPTQSENRRAPPAAGLHSLTFSCYNSISLQEDKHAPQSNLIDTKKSSSIVHCHRQPPRMINLYSFRASLRRWCLQLWWLKQRNRKAGNV